MKILILTGSPHIGGTTALLVDEFCIGAEKAGHEIIRYDAAKLDINPCIGCYHCRRNDGKCAYNDDLSQIYPHLLTSDAVVIATPLYYFGMSSQLKCAIDRFFSVNAALREKPKQLLLIAACGDEDEWAMDALTAHYRAICRYLKWNEAGMLLAIGAYTREDAEKSNYPKMARNLGEML